MKKNSIGTNAGSMGFAHLGLMIAAVVVIAAVAVGGWYVWHKNGDDNKQASKTSQTNQSQQTTDPSEGGKYLVISEWGVKIPLADSITRAYYTLNSDGLAEYVSLYDAAFDETKNANGISCGGSHKYQFYSISRTKPENVASLGDGAGPEYKKYPFTDQYVFGGLGAHQAPPSCSNLNSDPYGPVEDDQNILEIADQKEHAFNDAFNRLQPNL